MTARKLGNDLKVSGSVYLSTLTGSGTLTVKGKSALFITANSWLDMSGIGSEYLSFFVYNAGASTRSISTQTGWNFMVAGNSTTSSINLDPGEVLHLLMVPGQHLKVVSQN